MKKDETGRDNIIGRLVKNSFSEEPSDDFIDKVMEKIRLAPTPVPSQRTYFSMVKSTIPYLVVAAILVLILITSDFPVLNKLSVNHLFTGIFQHLVVMGKSLNNFFSSTYVSFGLMIGASLFVLIIIDVIFSRKRISQHQGMV